MMLTALLLTLTIPPSAVHPPLRLASDALQMEPTAMVKLLFHGTLHGHINRVVVPFIRCPFHLEVYHGTVTPSPPGKCYLWRAPQSVSPAYSCYETSRSWCSPFIAMIWAHEKRHQHSLCFWTGDRKENLPTAVGSVPCGEHPSKELHFAAILASTRIQTE